MENIPSEYDLARCLETISAIEADLGHLTANLTECQFQAPPRSGGWSIGYCVEHLILTGNAFIGTWDAALEGAARNGHASAGPSSYSWLERKILQFAEPPYRVKVKTTRCFAPCCRRPMDETVRRFRKMHQELAARARSSQGLDTARIKVQSPFVSRIRYSLGMSFDLVLAHERRHLWQAWQVRRQFSDQEKSR